MKNTAARMIITVLTVITVIAILLGLYINVFSGRKKIGMAETVSDTVTFEEEVKEISIEVDAAKINVSEGDRLSVNYTLPASEGSEVEMNNGKLSVTGGKNISVLSFGQIHDFSVDITVPAGTKLESFSLVLDAGEVSIGSFDAKQFSLNSDAGDMDIQKINSDSFEIAVDAGNISINDLAAGRAAIEVDAGNIEISNSSIDSIDAKVDAGNLEVKDSTIDHGCCESDLGNISLYGDIGDVQTKTGLGNTTVNGRKQRTETD